MLIVYSSSSQSLNVVYVKTQPLIHLLSGWCWADQSDCERLGVKARQWSAVHSYSTHIQSLSALHGANLAVQSFCQWAWCWEVQVDAYEVDHDKMLEAFRAIPAWVLDVVEWKKLVSQSSS